MNPIWLRFLVQLLAYGLLVGVVALWQGAEAGLMLWSVLLLGWLVLHVRQIGRLWRVINAPTYGTIPSALGVWGEIYYRLHKLVKGWHRQVLQAEQQHLRFTEAIQASPTGVLMLDENEQIEWCNAVAEQQFGLNAKRDARQKIVHLIRTPEFVHYLYASRFDEPLRLRGMGRNKQLIVSLQLFPYGDNKKLLLSQDITQLENTDAMRRDFVANVSHELKTPLTVLSGFLETVRDLPLSDAERSRYLDMMDAQAQRMRTLVDDLLTLAKIEANPQPPAGERVAAAPLLAQLEHDARALSRDAHRITVVDEAGFDLLGADTEVMSAFGNLVSNAVRYTQPGGEIEIGWVAVPGGARFYVRDTGPGIDAEHLPRLTERFYRVDRSRSRDTGGTGLGLAIVKHVASRHQWTLSIDSEPGRGSCFAVDVPTARLVSRQR